MRRVLLSTIVLVSLLSDNSKAQMLKGYGMKVGITSTDEVWQYSIPFAPPLSKRRVGFNLAVYAEWLNVPFFSLVTQVGYKQAGYVEEFHSANTTVSASNRIDYVSVPIFAKLTLPIGDVRPYILAGPRFDFQVGYDRANAYGDPSLAPPYDIFNKSIFGGSVGIGTEIQNLAPVQFLLEVLYNPDFSNAYQATYLRIRNNSYDLWLGVQI